MVGQDIDIDASDIIGKPIGIEVRKEPSDSLFGALLGSDEARYFHGIVKDFSSGVAVGDDKGFRAYYATLVPEAWILTQRTNCRVFQEKTIVDIIEAVLTDAGLKKGSDFSTSGIGGKLHKDKWDYCVQYRESDWAFVSRLCEQLGIYYYFEHDSSSHELVFSDKAPFKGKTVECTYKTFRDIEDEEDQITAWQHHHSMEPTKLTTTDYDFRNSAKDLAATVEDKGPGLLGALGGGGPSKLEKQMTRYEYPGYYQTVKEDTFGSKTEGKELAEAHMEAMEMGRHIIKGSTNSRKLGAAMLLKADIEHKPLKDDDGDKFLVTSIHHSYRQVVIPVGGHVGSLSYSNHFMAIPAKTPFRPPRKTPRPVVEGPQTAFVVGKKAYDAKSKSDQEIMTDKYGRVKVQFHWDRREEKGQKALEDSSCWIRVSQGHAGPGFGMINIPRKGEEVIVSFLDGDPDRPIITGRVYNAQNPVPYKLDDKKEKDNVYISGFKSRSSLKGDVTKHYNELKFQDKKGKEEIYFHAEKDFTRVVENKDVLIISDKKDITEKRIEKVAKATKDGSQSIEIFKHRTVTIQTGDEKFDVEKGNRTVTLLKGNDHHQIEEGHRTCKIMKGDDKLEVSKGDRLIEIKKGKHTLDVAKDITMKSDKNVKISAKDSEIALEVGQSSITLKKDGSISIDGKKITINGMKIALDAKQKILLKANQAIDVKAALGKVNVTGLKTKVEGKLGLELGGLKVDTKGKLMASQSGNIMSEVKAGALAKFKGAVTFVG